MKNLLKVLSVSIIAMIIVINATTVYASEDEEPKLPKGIKPPVKIEYLIY
ncbi:MAG: hypothetical protein GX053_02900 [Tissierella sp.]|nr:hypothetical protein [Tissierella sp.]